MTSPAITVRQLRHGDLAPVLALSHLVPEAPWWSETHIQQLLAPDTALDQRRTRRAWVSESADVSASGFIVLNALQLSGESMLLECEIEAIVVHPAHRRSGVGSALLQSAVAWCWHRGASVLRLEVRASNAAAISLYACFGFRTTGLRRNYYEAPSEDAVLMELQLAEQAQLPG